MAEYRFFGSETILRGSTLHEYGQVVDLDPADADALIAASPSALLLPEDLWDEIGITDAEIAEFPSVAVQSKAPEELRAKFAEVRTSYHGYRERLLNPGPAAGGFKKPGVVVTDEHPDITGGSEAPPKAA